MHITCPVDKVWTTIFFQNIFYNNYRNLSGKFLDAWKFFDRVVKTAFYEPMGTLESSRKNVKCSLPISKFRWEINLLRAWFSLRYTIRWEITTRNKRTNKFDAIWQRRGALNIRSTTGWTQSDNQTQEKVFTNNTAEKRLEFFKEKLSLLMETTLPATQQKLG